MRIYQQFNLPEDETEYRLAINAFEYWHSLLEISSILRGFEKGYIEDAEALADKIRDVIPWEKVDEIQ